MKHGPLAGRRGEVRLAVRPTDDGGVVVEIENPGAYAGPREGGSGLPILEKRLASAYGVRRGAFTIETHGDRTRATVRIPATVRDRSPDEELRRRRPAR